MQTQEGTHKLESQARKKSFLAYYKIYISPGRLSPVKLIRLITPEEIKLSKSFLDRVFYQEHLMYMANAVFGKPDIAG